MCLVECLKLHKTLIEASEQILVAGKCVELYVKKLPYQVNGKKKNFTKVGHILQDICQYCTCPSG
jgi:hypothetical protein